MTIRKSEIIIVGTVLLAFIVSVYFYPQLPDRIATHWNAKDQVNGYMSKNFGIFLTPVIMMVMVVVFKLIPLIDPLKTNYAKFRSYYDGFIIVFLLFMLGVQYFILLWNLGIKLSPNVFVPIGIGALFFFIGILCEHAKRNWFVGIRTPWTLSSDVVWDKTHKVGAVLFKIAGLIIASGMFFQKYLTFFILVPTILIAIFSLAYSYIEYQKQES
jgi:uncharacterized membrane protein